ncbi:hypothetical protein MP228_009633 [Amoeboaphelidium protococcarum]|nr:hypothetical protein MP228_009633 [Amoeboaphelidium protococcarum]
MAPILLKIKGNKSFSQLASLETEEELSKTWKICTKVKDSLENGCRLENLSWRLWHLHNKLLSSYKYQRVCGGCSNGSVNGDGVIVEEEHHIRRHRRRMGQDGEQLKRVGLLTTQKLKLDADSVRRRLSKRLNDTKSLDKESPQLSHSSVQIGEHAIEEVDEDEEVDSITAIKRHRDYLKSQNQLPLPSSQRRSQQEPHSDGVLNCQDGDIESTAHTVGSLDKMPNEVTPKDSHVHTKLTKNDHDIATPAEHTIHLEDFFGSLPATVILGNLEEGPRLEIPMTEIEYDNMSNWLTGMDDDLNLNFIQSASSSSQSVQMGNQEYKQQQYQNYDTSLLGQSFDSLMVRNMADSSQQSASQNNGYGLKSADNSMSMYYSFSGIRPQQGAGLAGSMAPSHLNPLSRSASFDVLNGNEQYHNKSSLYSNVDHLGQHGLSLGIQQSQMSFAELTTQSNQLQYQQQLSFNSSSASGGYGSTVVSRLQSLDSGQKNGPSGKAQKAKKPREPKKSTLLPSSSLPPAVAAHSAKSGDGKQQCPNCGTSNTPLWRRIPETGETLCNACGLYYKQHQKHRPMSLKALAAAKNGESEYVRPKCYNCQTDSTPLWRKDSVMVQDQQSGEEVEESIVLCNACGLYKKMHKAMRPISGEQSRKRRKLSVESLDSSVNNVHPSKSMPIEDNQGTATTTMQPVQRSSSEAASFQLSEPSPVMDALNPLQSYQQLQQPQNGQSPQNFSKYGAQLPHNLYTGLDQQNLGIHGMHQ